MESSPATRRRVWKASEEKTTMNIMESPATMMRRLRHAEDAYDGRWANDAEEAANAAFAAMGAEVERRDAERERERSRVEITRRERRAEHKWIKERDAELAAMRESDEARAAWAAAARIAEDAARGAAAAARGAARSAAAAAREVRAASSLDCRFRGLDALPRLSFETLVTLRADGNAIVRLPLRLQSLAPCLATLSLRRNLLEALPALPPRLETLDVADNDLARLFPECEALRTLVAAGNALTAANVAGTPFLTRLDLGSNQLAAVAGLGVLADLEVLELENRAWLRSDPDARPAANAVASLDFVAPLLHEPWPRLRELRVSGGGAALPTRIPASLRVLEARGCGLAALPAGDYAALESVDLEGNALEALPETWADLVRLTRLRVGRNRLATLPERLAAVRDLGVDRNRLTALPAAPRLEALDARGNRIGNAPSVLLSLDLSDNRVAAMAPLPPTVATVRLRNNRLLALPPLPEGLELLVVDGNSLGAIPAAPKLRLLEATRNRLSSLPELPALRVLAVAGRAGQESEIPNFKGSYLGRFPLVLADFWTSDHLSERSRSVDVVFVTRARETLTLKRR